MLHHADSTCSQINMLSKKFGINDLIDMNLSRLCELVRDSEAWRAAVHGVTRVGHDRVTELN